MPVIINEIVFKGEIAPPAERGEGRERASPAAQAAERRALVEEAVERVARLRERERER